MRPIIYLHIGASKTASSAIQTFLRINAAALEAAGIHVPDSRVDGTAEVSGQHVWFFQDLVNHPDGAGERLASHVARAIAAKPQCHSVMFSAENLSNRNSIPRLFKVLAEDYDLRIIFYIRRQDDFLISAWQQWFCKIKPDFHVWARNDWQQADWRGVCLHWADTVPFEKMRVKVYESVSQEQGGILHDLATAIGYPNPEQLRQPGRLENPSLSDAMTELMTGKKSLFKDIHDNRLFTMLNDLTGNKYHKRKGETFIPVNDRVEIIARYQQTNQWLCETFGLAENADTLFPDIRQQNLRELSAQDVNAEKEEIMLQLFLSLYTRLQEIDKRTKPTT